MKYRPIMTSALLLALTITVGCSDDSGGDDKRDGGGGGDSCTLKQSTVCETDTTYWIDSCGNRGEVAELCDCGCNTELSACKTTCECTPDCDNKDCGDDGCGSTCGECEGDTTCNAAGVCEGAQTPDELTLTGCNVPYVLDASKVTDMVYMATHFGDLVQEYCITGTVDGQDITTFPEKMYYGQHDGGSVVSLMQVSMTDTLAATWSVKLDFSPDSDFTAGSVWTPSVLGLEDQEVAVALLKHQGTSVCLAAIGSTGAVNVRQAENCTQIEGGTFAIDGKVGMIDPHDLGDLCTGASTPCCP